MLAIDVDEPILDSPYLLTMTVFPLTTYDSTKGGTQWSTMLSQVLIFVERKNSTEEHREPRTSSNWEWYNSVGINSHILIIHIHDQYSGWSKKQVEPLEQITTFLPIWSWTKIFIEETQHGNVEAQMTFKDYLV